MNKMGFHFKNNLGKIVRFIMPCGKTSNYNKTYNDYAVCS